jgi:hypothetical protein
MCVVVAVMIMTKRTRRRKRMTMGEWLPSVARRRERRGVT